MLTRSAQRAHGVLLPEVLDQAGVSPKQRQLQVRQGRWRRLPCGILVVAGVPETFEMLATAALAALPGSALSHESAGQVHGADVDDRSIHVCVPPGSTSRCAGIVVHRSPLLPADVTRRSGFAVTTLERTLIDLGSRLGKRSLRRLFEAALVSRSTTFDRLEDVFTRVCRQGRPGSARVRDVLIELDGNPPSESELEAMFVDLLGRAGIPRPASQVTFTWAGGETGRVDFWFSEARLIVELDGRRFHARLAAFERDRRRDQLALLNGQIPVRFTHHQLRNSPEHVLRVVRELSRPTNHVPSTP